MGVASPIWCGRCLNLLICYYYDVETCVSGLLVITARKGTPDGHARFLRSAGAAGVEVGYATQTLAAVTSSLVPDF